MSPQLQNEEYEGQFGEFAADMPTTPRPAHGVSPCFVNCGQPACQKLGCVHVYNAEHGEAQRG